jgi:hypothetical protein
VSSSDPNRPFDPIVDLPNDPTAARDELRRRLAGEWELLLARSGLRYAFANFATRYHTDGDGWWSAELIVSFDEVPQGVETAMISATQASGWSQAGVSHGLNLRKGSFHLKGGCGVDGCYYILDTGPRLTQKLAVVPEGYTLRVEELESHLDPAAPAPTRR